MGTITSCNGATRGGVTSPSSSECVIMRPPTIRVETPQEVFHAYSRFPSRGLELQFERLCEILPEVVARCRFAMLCYLGHQRFGGIGTECAGKTLAIGSESNQDGHGEIFFHERAILPRAFSTPLLPLAVRFRARSDPPATKIPSCEETAASAFPSAQHLPIGSIKIGRSR